MNKLAKFWRYVDGKKTLLMWGAHTILTEAVNLDILPDDNKWLNLTVRITFILGTGGLAHKGQKKFFPKKK